MSDFRLNTRDNLGIYRVWEALPHYMRNGDYQPLWQSPAFQSAYENAAEQSQSAFHLKKHLPPQYIALVRFIQSPVRWTLTVTDTKLEKQIRQCLTTHATDISLALNTLPNVGLRVVVNNWASSGYLLSRSKDDEKTFPSLLKLYLPDEIHTEIRLKRYPSIWHIYVQKSLTASRLAVLFDELSERIAKDIGYTPILKIHVQPENWISTGFSLTELVPKKQLTPTDNEADEIIEAFLNTTISR